MAFKMLLVLLLGLLVCSIIDARKPMGSEEKGSSRDHKTFMPYYRGGGLQGVGGRAIGGGGQPEGGVVAGGGQPEGGGVVGGGELGGGGDVGGGDLGGGGAGGGLGGAGPP